MCVYHYLFNGLLRFGGVYVSVCVCVCVTICLTICSILGVYT